jgi:hypothetical protein
MTDRDNLRWELQRHLDQRPPSRGAEPAAWLVIGVLLAGVALLGWVAYRVADRWLQW